MIMLQRSARTHFAHACVQVEAAHMHVHCTVSSLKASCALWLMMTDTCLLLSCFSPSLSSLSCLCFFAPVGVFKVRGVCFNQSVNFIYVSAPTWQRRGVASFEDNFLSFLPPKSPHSQRVCDVAYDSGYFALIVFREEELSPWLSWVGDNWSKKSWRKSC